MEMAQNGVRTRAQAALAMEQEATSSPAQQTPKRRKINTTTTTTTNTKPERELPAEKEERHTSDDLPASCCSSNGSVGHEEEANDLEVESAQVETSTCNCVEQQEEETHRREMSHASKNGGNSQEMESMEANSHRPASTAPAIRKPTEAELDEFFSASEKEMQQRFQEKYNFDIEKDVPLEGRYEWVQLKP